MVAIIDQVVLKTQTDLRSSHDTQVPKKNVELLFARNVVKENIEKKGIRNY